MRLAPRMLDVPPDDGSPLLVGGRAGSSLAVCICEMSDPRGKTGTDVGLSRYARGVLCDPIKGIATMDEVPSDERRPLGVADDLLRTEETGTGRKVGVEGRELPVAIDEFVEIVLAMDERPSVEADKRDCGRLSVLSVALGDEIATASCRKRNADGALRSSDDRELFELSCDRRFLGIGDFSSMMRTHPGDSAPVRSRSFS